MTSTPVRQHFSGSVIGRFVARRTFKSAGIWALVFGVYMAEKSLAFASAYPTQASRQKISGSFANNVGLKALLGTPHQINTIAGFANWNTLGVLTIIASIWAFLLATKYFRGEEENGRLELLLSGQTTARRAALNTFFGLLSSLVLMFAVSALIFAIAGNSTKLNFGLAGSIFFALSSVVGAALFLCIGALTSQIMPTKSRATMLAAGLFGVFFILRATGDITSAHWLLDVSPLGWIEKLQPLVGSRPIWLLPILLLCLILASLSIYLAGQRDLGESLIPDRDSVKPRFKLLNSSLGASLRFSRANAIGWLCIGTLVGIFYGLLTKSATQAFNSSGGIKKEVNKLVRVHNLNLSLLFLGIVFLLLTALTMSHAASAISKVRHDEADGYLDNFMVRPVGRLKWLSQQSLIASLSCMAMCLLCAIGVYIGQAIEGTGVGFSELIKAGANIIAPSLFIVGAGIFAFGFVPRLTSFVAYGVLGWSFLLYLISSGLNLNHYLLDTSLLHQITLAPALPPNWTVDGMMALVGLALFILGALRFNRRDLQYE